MDFWRNPFRNYQGNLWKVLFKNLFHKMETHLEKFQKKISEGILGEISITILWWFFKENHRGISEARLGRFWNEILCYGILGKTSGGMIRLISKEFMENFLESLWKIICRISRIFNPWVISEEICGRMNKM